MPSGLRTLRGMEPRPPEPTTRGSAPELGSFARFFAIPRAIVFRVALVGPGASGGACPPKPSAARGDIGFVWPDESRRKFGSKPFAHVAFVESTAPPDWVRSRFFFAFSHAFAPSGPGSAAVPSVAALAGGLAPRRSPRGGPAPRGLGSFARFFAIACALMLPNWQRAAERETLPIQKVIARRLNFSSLFSKSPRGLRGSRGPDRRESEAGLMESWC